MRIVHLAYFYGQNSISGGAPIAATRLHQALLRAGIDSHYVCVKAMEQGKNVHEIPGSKLLNLLFYIATRGLWILSKLFCGKIYMANLIPLPGLKKTLDQLNPDVIHAHYIYQDMVSFKQLIPFSGKIVITLHDLLAINAYGPHPEKDRRFVEGYNSQNSPYIERVVFNRKNKFVKQTSPVFVGPSQWVCNQCKESIIGNARPCFAVSNIIDRVYSFKENLLEIHQKFTVLFIACGGRKAQYKGWDDLEKAIDYLPCEIRANTEILVVGENSDDCRIKDIDLKFAGIVSSSYEMKKIHHRADVLAFPSKYETQGMVKIESLLDGLPVVAFDRSACADGIIHRQNGWVANDGDISGFADGLIYFYNKFIDDSLVAIRKNIATFASNKYDENNIVKQMIDVYNFTSSDETLNS